MRLTSHLASTTDKVESTVTDSLAKGIGKLKAFEHELHLRTKQFQRKLALLSIAILVAILGVGVWALAAYQAFSEVMPPSLAAFVTGTALFAICGMLLYLSQHPKVLKYRLGKVRS